MTLLQFLDKNLPAIGDGAMVIAFLIFIYMMMRKL